MRKQMYSSATATVEDSYIYISHSKRKISISGVQRKETAMSWSHSHGS